MVISVEDYKTGRLQVVTPPDMIAPGSKLVQPHSDMRIPLVNLPEGHRPYQIEPDRGIERAIASGGYIGSEEVHAFEEGLAAYPGLAPWSTISCGNGSNTLLLALVALELPRGGEVIIATHNYVAAAEVVRHLELRPVWADVMPSLSSNGRVSFQMNGSLDYLESLRTPRTVALIAVNMYGIPCLVVELVHSCKRHQIPWAEDNAQGMGGVGEIASGVTKATAPLGTRATVGTTSFFPTKPLGCMGDGGTTLVPHDQQLAKRLRQLANHGQRTRYQYERCGYNSRLDVLRAAVLRVKLRHLDEANRRRSLLADRYDGLPADLLMVRHPKRSTGQPGVLHLYTVCVPSDKRDRPLNELRTAGIDARVYYPQMLYQIAACSDGSSEASCPVAEEIQKTMFSLPIAPTTTPEQIRKIYERIRQFLL